MNKKLIAAMALMTTALFTSVVLADGASVGTSVSVVVTVTGTCGISATTPIDFGSLSPYQISADKISTITMTGNKALTGLTVKGTQWSDGGTNTFAVGQTHWSSSDAAYISMTPLTTSDVSLGSTTLPLDVHFKLQIPSTQVAASYGQTITFTANCD